MRIAVIGSGYVGLVSAACFTEIDHEVISGDSETAKIAALERGETPIHGLMRTNGAAVGSRQKRRQLQQASRAFVGWVDVNQM